MNEPDKRSDTALARCGISELALVIHQLPAAALTASRAGSPASHVKLIRPYLDAYGQQRRLPLHVRSPSRDV